MTDQRVRDWFCLVWRHRHDGPVNRLVCRLAIRNLRVDRDRRRGMGDLTVFLPDGWEVVPASSSARDREIAEAVAWQFGMPTRTVEP